MLKGIGLLFVLLVNTALSKTVEIHKQYLVKHSPSEFEVIPLNSPVKGNIARFLLKTPQNYVIEEVRFKIKNTLDVFAKEKNYSILKLVNGTQGKELHLDVSKYSDGFYRLFLRVKNKTKKNGKWDYGENDYKSVHKDFISFVIERPNQVPMPDPAENNSTLRGIDSDNDGVRDDVQIWIESRAQSEDIKLAVKQYARSLRNRYLVIGDKEKTIALNHEALRSQQCLGDKLMATGMTGGDVIKNLAEVVAFHKNTKERIKASFLIDEYFHGQSMLSYSDNACDF